MKICHFCSKPKSGYNDYCSSRCADNRDPYDKLTKSDLLDYILLLSERIYALEHPANPFLEENKK